MKALLLALLLPAAAAAQTLPEHQMETRNAEVSEYLDQQIRKERQERKDAPTEDTDFTGANTHSGNETFNSTATFNQQVVFNSSVTLNGTLFGSVNVSSTADIPANNTMITESALGVAVNNSTRTIITNQSSRHQLVVSAPIRISDAAGTQVMCGFLRNGAFFDGQSATKGVWSANNLAAAGMVVTMSATWNTLTSQAAGTYAYTITCATASGNLMFCQNDNAAADAACFFEVREIK